MDLNWEYATKRQNLGKLPEETPEQLTEKIRRVQWELDSVIGHLETAKRHQRWLDVSMSELKFAQVLQKINAPVPGAKEEK